VLQNLRICAHLLHDDLLGLSSSNVGDLRLWLHGQQQQQQRKCNRQHDISNDCLRLDQAIAEPGQSSSSQDEALTEPDRALQLFNIKRLRHGVSAVLQRRCDMQKQKKVAAKCHRGAAA
jgi:hypothetical protein